MDRSLVELVLKSQDSMVVLNGGSVPYNYSHVAMISQNRIHNIAD